jgi:hypothetical protein
VSGKLPPVNIHVPATDWEFTVKNTFIKNNSKTNNLLVVFMTYKLKKLMMKRTFLITFSAKTDTQKLKKLGFKLINNPQYYLFESIKNSET